MFINEHFAANLRELQRTRPRFTQDQLLQLGPILESGCCETCRAFVTDHVLLLVRFAGTMSRGLQPDDANDLLQEIFLLAFRKAHQYRPDKGRPGSFLKVLVRHCVINHRTKLRRESERFQQYPESHEEGAAFDIVDPSRVVEFDDRIIVLKQRIQLLPERYRLIINQRMNGLSLQEIGQKLELTKERVRQLELKAMEFLKGGPPIRKSGRPSKSKSGSSKEKGKAGGRNRPCPDSNSLREKGKSEDDLSFEVDRTVVNTTVVQTG